MAQKRQLGLVFGLPRAAQDTVTVQVTMRSSLEDHPGWEGNATNVHSYPASAIETDEVFFDDVPGLIVNVGVVDIDAAGTRCHPHERKFAIADGPAEKHVPGHFVLKSVREVMVDVPDEEPANEAAPADSSEAQSSSDAGGENSQTATGDAPQGDPVE